MLFSAYAGLVDSEDLPEDPHDLVDEAGEAFLMASAGAVFRRNGVNRTATGVAVAVIVFINMPRCRNYFSFNKNLTAT